MDEGDLEPEHTVPGRGVDQLCTRGGELVERGPDVGDLVGDVMHAGPAFHEEPADRRVLGESRQQLDSAVPDADGRRLDPLLLDPLPVLDTTAEQPLVGRHRRIEIVDGETDVVDPACFHAGDRMRKAARGAHSGGRRRLPRAPRRLEA